MAGVKTAYFGYFGAVQPGFWGESKGPKTGMVCYICTYLSAKAIPTPSDDSFFTEVCTYRGSGGYPGNFSGMVCYICTHLSEKRTIR
jgi:hypothetical protein